MRDLQARLRELGDDPGAIDGDWGPKTKAAVLAALRRTPPAPAPSPVVGIVPADWMPEARMHRIVCHWTGGGHVPNSVDLAAYHILIEGGGKLRRGNHSIRANQAPIGGPGTYAAHILGANTGAIGVSMCCMAGAVERPLNFGPFPMAAPQWRGMIAVVADLCRRYRIPVAPETVGSHAEYQGDRKWDFTVLPFDPSISGARAIGDRLRAEVTAALA